MSWRLLNCSLTNVGTDRSVEFHGGGNTAAVDGSDSGGGGGGGGGLYSIMKCSSTRWRIVQDYSSAVNTLKYPQIRSITCIKI